MKQFDLNTIRVAFIDFDDTAVIHLDHGKWGDWFDCCLRDNPAPYYRDGRTAPLPGMSNFLHELVKREIVTYCLTWDHVATTAIPKQKVLDSYYGEGRFKRVIVCCSREQKVKFIQEYCEQYNIKPYNVLVVDDTVATIDACHALGCTVATPQEICVRYLGLGSLV